MQRLCFRIEMLSWLLNTLSQVGPRLRSLPVDSKINQ